MVMDANPFASIPTPSALPAPPPQPLRPARWRLLLALAVGLVVAAVPVPAVVVYAVATAVDKGAGCAQCAALDWVNYLGSLWWDNDGETRAAKDTAPARRGTLLAERAAYIRQIRADIPRFPMVAGTDFEQFGTDSLQVASHGDTATVTMEVAARWPNEADRALWFYSEAGTWRFDVRRDSAGWRIWTVDMPPWCGTYSRCTAPCQRPRSARHRQMKTCSPRSVRCCPARPTTHTGNGTVARRARPRRNVPRLGRRLSPVDGHQVVDGDVGASG